MTEGSLWEVCEQNTLWGISVLFLGLSVLAWDPFGSQFEES